MYIPYTTLSAIQQDRVRDLLSRRDSRTHAAGSPRVEKEPSRVRQLIVAFRPAR